MSFLFSGGNAPTIRLPSRLPEFMRRIIQRDQMELDSALNQMWCLITSPSTVNKMAKARKMTKNHYYRDDPAFLVLQVLFLATTTLAFGITFSSSFLLILYNMVYQVAIDYLVLGAILSNLIWLFANKFMMNRGNTGIHEVRRDVEWAYSYDIHCNSYFVYFVFTHVLQFLLLPVLIHNSFFSRFLGNSLYAVGATLYFYLSFKAYLELPSLSKQQLLLYPVVGIVALSAIATLTTHINMTHFMVHHVWPSGVAVQEV